MSYLTDFQAALERFVQKIKADQTSMTALQNTIDQLRKDRVALEATLAAAKAELEQVKAASAQALANSAAQLKANEALAKETEEKAKALIADAQRQWNEASELKAAILKQVDAFKAKEAEFAAKFEALKTIIQ